MIDFTKLLVGSRVWSINFGWGSIQKFQDGTYPIVVSFGDRTESYTKNGKWVLTAINPAIFINEFSVPSEVMTPIDVDTKILVKDKYERCWKKRYFAKMDNGRVRAFANGATSFSAEGETILWDEWKYPDE